MVGNKMEEEMNASDSSRAIRGKLLVLIEKVLQRCREKNNDGTCKNCPYAGECITDYDKLVDMLLN